MGDPAKFFREGEQIGTAILGICDHGYYEEEWNPADTPAGKRFQSELSSEDLQANVEHADGLLIEFEEPDSHVRINALAFGFFPDNRIFFRMIQPETEEAIRERGRVTKPNIKNESGDA